VYEKNIENIPGEFAAAGLQVAGDVQFNLNEPKGTGSFRIGLFRLFGLEKLLYVKGAELDQK